MEQANVDTPAFLSTLAWAEKNKKQLMYGAVALVLVGFVVAYMRWSSREQEAAAGQDLSKAIFSRGQTGGNPADAFLKVAADHPKTAAGEQALLLAANALFKAGKFDEAQKVFQRFQTENPDSKLAAQALLGAGTSFAAQGKWEDAVRTLKECVDKYPLASALDHAKFGLAQAYEQVGKGDLALPLYEAVIRDSVAASIRNEAVERFQVLQPQLAPPAVVPEAGATNPPPTKP